MLHQKLGDKAARDKEAGFGQANAALRLSGTEQRFTAEGMYINSNVFDKCLVERVWQGEAPVVQIITR